jgi:hypothetical protein
MASLQALREEVEAFCRAQTEALADEAAGRVALADLGAVDSAHPTVVAPDTLSALQAAASSGRTPEAQRSRLRVLVGFLGRTVVEARTRSADDALRQARATRIVSAAGDAHPLSTAWAAMAGEPDRLRRAALARATEDVELQLRDGVQRRWEAMRIAAERAGVPPPAAFGPPEQVAALEGEAREFLRSTDDAWREVLRYACRRLDPSLEPLPRGDAALHDLLRLSSAPLAGAFPPADRLPALRLWLDRSGLTLEAGSRIRLETRDPPQSPLPAASFAVDPPGHIRLVTSGAAAGHGAFPALLDAAGRARAAAAVSGAAPLEARRMGDLAVGSSPGWLFRGVLRSERWLRHSLDQSRATAREVARISALSQLGELRMASVRLPLVHALAASGPTAAAVDGLAAGLSEALRLRVTPGAVLGCLARWPAEAEELQAAALAERIHRQADERFDADDFRNPAAARWLEGLWARGRALDADALAQEISGAPLSLADVSRRLVAVLGA